MQEVWQDFFSHQTVYSKLWSFGVRCIYIPVWFVWRQWSPSSLWESVPIKWIDVSQQHNRKCRLRDHSELVEMRERDPNCMNIFEANSGCTFYPKRPNDLGDVCLYVFIADFMLSVEDKDGQIKYWRLNKMFSLITNSMIQTRRKKRRATTTTLYSYSLSPSAGFGRRWDGWWCIPATYGSQ